jgi:Raf kinase inhibitor-like YbhB/YbcL family protein
MEKKLTLNSAMLHEGQRLPDAMVMTGVTSTAKNMSPDLKWSGAPVETKSFAVTMYDPDAPTGGLGFVHWVLFNIPADVHELEEGIGGKGNAGVGAMHGHNDYGFAGYGGAAPPKGDPSHHYTVTVYALDLPKLDLDQTTTLAKLRFMMRGHVLTSGQITALYSA